MIDLTVIKNENEFPEGIDRDQFIDFLYNHLDQFGDPREDIGNCIDYAFSSAEGKGGFLISAQKDGKLVGALIMNETGMGGYIPENYLVYIAVDASERGQGIGGSIMDNALEVAQGDVALHVEYENPAKRLYERKGFTNKYAEMRYHKE